jgi:hypothetical protein
MEKGKSNRGFGSMDENKKREIASQGGRASAQSDTSNRGFASMDKEKQRKISSHGGRASQSSATSKGREVSVPGIKKNKDSEDVNDQITASMQDLDALQRADLSGLKGKNTQSEAHNDTDEDENEGLGNGNLGRSTR